MNKRTLILLVVSIVTSIQNTQAAEKSDLVEEALALEKTGASGGALILYGKALEKFPNDSVALIDRANLRFNMGDRQGALADINRALKINTIDFNALRTRADFKTAIGNNKGALEDYNEAIKWNAKDAISYTNRGIMRVSMGDTKSALADFEKAISIDNDLTARCNRIRILPDQTAARAEYDKLLKTNISDEDDRLALSNAHVHFGNKQKAIDELNKALLNSPSFTATLFNRAVLKADLGDKDGALIDYNKYIQLNASNPKAFFNRSLLRDQMNDRAGAMNDLKHALELDPLLKMKEGTRKPFELMLS